MPGPLRMLVFGFPGSGKTHLIGTASGDPRLTPSLIVDFEGGLDPLESKLREMRITGNRPRVKLEPVDSTITGRPLDFVKVRTWDDFEDVFSILNDEKDHKYKSVFVDSLTELNYMNLQKCVLDNHRRDPAKHPSKVKALIGDYGDSAAEMRFMFRCFQKLPLHVFYTCHQKEVDDETSNIKPITPNLVGKLADELPGLVNVVGYLKVRTAANPNSLPKRVLITRADGRLVVKDRSEGQKLQGTLEDPTMSKVLDLLKIE